MQHIKWSEKIVVLKEVVHMDVVLTDSLAKVIDKFEIEKHFLSFNKLKDRGFTLGSLLKVSIITPFVGVANVYALLKYGINWLIIKYLITMILLIFSFLPDYFPSDIVFNKFNYIWKIKVYRYNLYKL